MRTVNILGIEYTIQQKKYDEDPMFKEKEIDGYCEVIGKSINYGHMKTFPGWERQNDDVVAVYEKQTLRHEIMHAFLFESGLDACSMITGRAWAVNEEMVDWIAIQFPKILKVYEEVGAI